MPEKKKLSKTREMLVNEYVKSLEQDQLPWICLLYTSRCV